MRTTKSATVTELNPPLKRWLTFERLPFLVIGYGIAVRLAQYLPNRTFWYDEVALALNILERSWLKLFAPLRYAQAAPIGFLWAEKLSVQLFGNSEYSFRLFPLLCGILSLFLFYFLLKKYFQLATVILGLILFATAEDLIYYASELKQYSSDVAIALIGFFITIQLTRTELTKWQIALISLSGAWLIWFSHPIIFILAAGILSASWAGIQHKTRLQRLTPIAITWFISFLVFYWSTVTSIETRSNLKTRWLSRGAFPASPWDIDWLIRDVPHQLFGRAVVFGQDAYTYNPLVYLAVAAFAIGCVTCWRKQKQALILVLPILITLIAAAIGKYPFHSRLVLFLAPFAIALTAEGIVTTCHQIQTLTSQQFAKADLKSNSKPVYWLSSWFVAVLLTSAIALPPIQRSIRFFQQPIVRQDIKPILNYIKSQRRSGDFLYVLPYGYPAAPSRTQLKYYRSHYELRSDNYNYRQGRKLKQLTQQQVQAELDRLREETRVWVLFSPGKEPANASIIKLYQEHLSTIGAKLDEFQTQEYLVQLYKMH